MLIKSSSSIKNDYNAISEYCRKERKPVFLTENGEGDLVVMSIEEYSYREEVIDIWEKLLEAEEHRVKGAKTYSLEEIDNMMDGIINGRE